MEATLSLPPTLNARLQLPATLRVTASWEEFLELLPECDYRIEYNHGQIISLTGYATENHEDLVLKIAELLRELLGEDTYSFRGSNLALHAPGGEKNYYNADCTVIQGPSEKVPLKGSMYAIANPVLLVEVLSDTTAAYDLSHKFAAYRRIPSLRQVLFIDSESRHVISQTRVAEQDGWLLKEYNTPAAEVEVLQAGTFKLADLYARIKFEEKST